MADSNYNFKQQQQLVSLIQSVGQKETNATSQPMTSITGMVLNVYTNSTFADVRIYSGSNPTILTKISNKSNVILSIGDVCQITEPHGDLTSCYIDKNYNNEITIAAEHILGVLTIGGSKDSNGELIMKDSTVDSIALRFYNHSIDFYDWLQTGLRVGSMSVMRELDANGNGNGTPCVNLVAEQGGYLVFGMRNDDDITSQESFIINNKGRNNTRDITCGVPFNVISNLNVKIDGSHAMYIQPTTDGGNQIYGNLNCEGYDVNSIGTLTTQNLQVNGTKNCVQSTKTFGKRLFTSSESADSNLFDWGFGKTNNCECVIAIDPIVIESINTEMGYLIEIHPYKNYYYEIVEQTPRYFVVHADKDFEFGFKILGKRIGHETERLEFADNISNVLNQPNEVNMLLDGLHDESDDFLNKSLFKQLDDDNESLSL
jgi:hypothetical protein